MSQSLLTPALDAFALSLASCAPLSPEAGSRAEYPSNVIAINKDDEIRFNGEPITIKELTIVLGEVAKMEPEPDLMLEPSAGASYEVSAQVLRVIKESGVTKFGFVGNEKYPANESTHD